MGFTQINYTKKMKDIALHVLDLVQNSISAGANLIEIELEENVKTDRYTMTIKDNGKGMGKEFLKTVADPYATTRVHRKVGMGIPFLVQNVEASGGEFEIDSEIGKGTVLKAAFGMRHIDRIPLGDIAGAVIMSVNMNPDKDFVYKHTNANGTYCFDTREIKATLEEVPINNFEISRFLREMIDENIEELKVEK